MTGDWEAATRLIRATFVNGKVAAGCTVIHIGNVEFLNEWLSFVSLSTVFDLSHG